MSDEKTIYDIPDLPPESIYTSIPSIQLVEVGERLVPDALCMTCKSTGTLGSAGERCFACTSCWKIYADEMNAKQSVNDLLKNTAPITLTHSADAQCISQTFYANKISVQSFMQFNIDGSFSVGLYGLLGGYCPVEEYVFEIARNRFVAAWEKFFSKSSAPIKFIKSYRETSRAEFPHRFRNSHVGLKG